MEHSVVEMQPELYGKTLAKGYTALNRNGQRKSANFYQTKVMQPAAGISSNIGDLAKFVKWQFRLTSAKEKELLSADTLISMYKPHATDKSGRLKRGFGYESFIDDKGGHWVMHGGICPGYVSYLKMDVTNKMAYIFIVNANRVKALAYVNGLIDIFSRINDQPLLTLTDKTLDTTDTVDYLGYYNLNPWNSEYYVGQWGNGLVLLYLPAKSLRYALYYYLPTEQKDHFQLVENGELKQESITFIRNDHDIVTGVLNGGNIHKKMP